MPLPAGDTPAKLASTLRPPAPVGPRAESAEPEWLGGRNPVRRQRLVWRRRVRGRRRGERRPHFLAGQRPRLVRCRPDRRDRPRRTARGRAAGARAHRRGDGGRHRRARTGGRRRCARTRSGRRGHHRRHGHPRAHPAVPRRRQQFRCSGALGLQRGGPARAARHHWVPSHLPRLPRGRTRRLYCGHHRSRSARICCASRLGQPRPQLAARFRNLFGGRRRRTRARRVYTNQAFGGNGFESPRVAAAGGLGTTTGTSAVMFLVLCFPGIQHVAGGGARNLV